MIHLIIGGAYQGKLRYALANTGHTMEGVADGAYCELAEALGKPVIDHFQLLVRRLVAAGEDVEALVALLAARPLDVLIIADEVGSGLVPIDDFERAWREAAGRACCALAEQAVVVERVFCGLPLCIKGQAHA